LQNIKFIEGGGKIARITKADLYYEILKGNAGTTIVKTKKNIEYKTLQKIAYVSAVGWKSWLYSI